MRNITLSQARTGKSQTISTHFNESLFALYTYLFTIMTGIIYLVPTMSFILLLFVVIGIVATSLIYNNLQLHNLSAMLPMLSIVMLLFLLDLLLRRNDFSFSYIYYFLIFGIIPIYLYSQTQDKRAIIKGFVKLSVFVFLLYFWVPFFGYKVFSDYMAFGYNFALPVFCGLYIGYEYFKYKWVMVLEIIALAELIVFSNKGAVLTGLIFVFIYNVVINKRDMKQLVRILIVTIIAVYMVSNLADILNFFANTLNSLGVSSYSLATLRRMILTGEYSIGLASRDIIWETAFVYIKKNLLFGIGTGGFQSLTGTYAHNFAIDILVQYGALGFFIFIIAFLRSAKAVFYKTQQMDKLFGVLMLCLWIVPLSTSMMLFESLYFWVFLFFGFVDCRGRSLYLPAQEE